MNNYDLILEERYRLLEEGIIGEQERIYTLPDGTEQKVQEPEEIHTIARWKELGYRVKDSSKPITILPIWRAVKERKGKKVTTKIIRVDGVFYSREQVAPL